ncbi:FAD-dependent oxidoreductase [Methylocapsa palsarum]|uniref:Reductase C-terminal n=1 Tax=Methylocapsa palsarum TaxID=1612308 RepID=A0A1I3XBH8_9HYPH|nr:FAD-dependent oxidoreductase [Methylocapsa palsarum]SFK16787.1 Reductase C-terminal [Methylocapsa palsarum]
MSADSPSGPDFSLGIEANAVADGGMILGRVGDDPVLLARRGDEVFAIGAVCSHYSGPLAEGLLVGETVRCPWHHACFSLRTGEALRAPALSPVSCWRVERRDGKLFVGEKLERPTRPPARLAPGGPERVVIIGGGAAGNSAAETLRKEGFSGAITMFSADDSLPYDRPNLSKGFLSGAAPQEWIPLRSREFYEAQGIDIKLDARVVALDAAARLVSLADGGRHPYDALLLATGAEPVRLDIPGADLPHVRTLRTFADSQALVADALVAQTLGSGTPAPKRAVVIGASFIGLEAAAALRARNVEVHVVGREAVPMERILGAEAGAFIRKLHEEHGVKFHLGDSPASIDQQGVLLQSGERIGADFVLAGIGVRPCVALAKKAGLTIDRGIVVDEYLETSAPGVFAAGDIARWPDRLSGSSIRVEHWVVAERQGQTAARNILGLHEKFDAVPFFWTEQYDLAIAYVGHAERWDEIEIKGAVEARDCEIVYRLEGRKLAVATIFRDVDSLRAELEFEELIASTVTRAKT